MLVLTLRSPGKKLSLDTHGVFFFSYAFHNSWLTGLIADHSSFPTQHGELLLPFHNGNSAQNSAVRKQYGIQKIRNFRFINMKVSSVGACEHLTRLSC